MNLHNKIIGFLPPQDIELEKSVLGGILLETTALEKVIDYVVPETFFDPKHSIIYATIITLFKESIPIDLMTVIIKIRQDKNLEVCGGAAYISSLVNNIASSVNIEYYSRSLLELQIKRQLISVGQNASKSGYDASEDAFHSIQRMGDELSLISERFSAKSTQNIQQIAIEAINEITNARKNSDGVSGVPTGFNDLDNLTGGWQRPDLIILAARPAMGKTAFVLSMARNIAVDHKKPVLFFSLEMSSVQLVKRLISAESEISSSSIMKGKISDDELHKIHSRIQNLIAAPLFIDDTPGLTVLQLKAKAKKFKQTENIELIVIDYLQLMNSDIFGSREQQISNISRSIKELAKELNVPIIALSQLSRDVEKRGGDKKPILSDLRESGAIEQDADIVAFIHRPEYYGFITDEAGESNLGVAELIIAKHRNGALDTIKMNYVAQYTRFENLHKFETFTVEEEFNNAAINNFHIDNEFNDF